jgi:hypothetical protein
MSEFPTLLEAQWMLSEFFTEYEEALKEKDEPFPSTQLASSCPGQSVSSMYLSQIAILCFPYLPAAAANDHQLLVVVCPQNHLILLDSHR